MLEKTINRDNQLIFRTKLLIRDLWIKARQMRRVERCLPNFVILGAQKAGTTSLYAYLSQHPQIVPAALKEVHYFDLYRNKKVDWYRAHFPFQDELKAGQITGEATPYYLFHPGAAKMMSAVLPNVKLIILLRNPVDRAISHYYHEVKNGKETLPLQQALASEETRLSAELFRIGEGEQIRKYAHQRFSYKSRGVYVNQIRDYLSYFRPEQFHIICSERFFEQTEEVYREVLQFLDCDSGFVPLSLAPRRVGSYEEKQPQIVEQLQMHFAPYNLELFSLIWENFPQFSHCEQWWH